MQTGLTIPPITMPPGFEKLIPIMGSVLLIIITTFIVVVVWTVYLDAYHNPQRYNRSILLATTAVVVDVIALFVVSIGLVQLPQVYILLIAATIACAVAMIFMGAYRAVMAYLDRKANQRRTSQLH